MEKVRKAFYVEEELLGQVDALLPQADVRSRNEFVNQALRFYIGYLTSEKIENYMLTTISSVMHATVKDSENRMARAMYKLAVETSKLSHVIAYSHGVDEQALGKLQAKCAEEVKRISSYIGLDIITVFFILFPFVILNAKFEKTSGTSSNCFLPDTEYCFNNDIITP